MRGCVAFLGVLLAAPALAGLYALVRGLLPVASEEIVRAVAIQIALALVVSVFVLGFLLVLHALRGTSPLPPRVMRVEMDVFLFAALLVVCVIAGILAGRGDARVDAARAVLVLVLGALAAALLAGAVDLWMRASGLASGLLSGGARLALGVIIVVLFLVGASLASSPPTSAHPRDIRLTETIHNARCLSTLLSERSIRCGWPPRGGKRFVLSLAAERIVDPRNPANLEVFFSPCLERAPNAPSREDFLRLTPEALCAAHFAAFTHFAGRRNEDPRYALSRNAHRETEPILACVLPGRGVVVGFSDGAARFLDLGDLGLEPGAPIEVGDRARVPLLRALSDE